jgi:hypothetical protein
LLLQHFDPSLTNPAPYFGGKQAEEHDQEPAANLATEYRHRQTCFSDREPRFLVELFDLDRSQRSKEELLEAEEEGACGQEYEVC